MMCLSFSFLFFSFSVGLQIHTQYAWTIIHIDSYTRTDRLYAHRPLVYSINTCYFGCVFFSLFLLESNLLLYSELY
jgi:hypothetical protein